VNRLAELYTRELAVCACLKSSVAAIRLGLHALHDDPKTLAEPAEVWFARAESSLLFAAAELSYLTAPAPAPLTVHAIPFGR